MTLATLGREKYAEVVEKQLSMAKHLADKLNANGFEIKNGASLAVVCFLPPKQWYICEHAQFEYLAQRACETGETWISATKLGGQSVLRACITSHLTEKSDLDHLVSLLLSLRPEN